MIRFLEFIIRKSSNKLKTIKIRIFVIVPMLKQLWCPLKEICKAKDVDKGQSRFQSEVNMYGMTHFCRYICKGGVTHPCPSWRGGAVWWV